MKLPKNLNPLYAPYGDFQTETIGFGVIKDNPGLLLPVGCGKTYCSINICKWRLENEGLNRVLILCPSTIMLKWQEEIEKFSGYDSLVLYNPVREKRIEIIKQFKEEDYKFGIINYEALAPYYAYVSKLYPDMIVADESARYIKNYVTHFKRDKGYSEPQFVKRTVATVDLGDQAKHRMILTGTLIASNPLNIWSQFRFLDVSIFGNNFYAWRNHYFKKADYGRYHKWEIKPERIQKLNSKIFEACIKFEKKDIFPDLPPTVFVKIPIDMSDSLRELYNKVKLEILAEIETDEGSALIDIRNIFTKLIRLQQITSGYVKDSYGQIRNLKQTPKIDAVIEEVETILEDNESAILWCRFRYTIELLEKALKKKKIKYTVMHGDTKNKGEVWKGFQKSKTVNVFIGQVEAGGIGIELFKLDSDEEYQHMLFVENTFVLDHREQAQGRSEHRIGQKAACRIVDFLVKDTIDEKIFYSVMKNKKIADEIMKSGVRGWLE